MVLYFADMGVKRTMNLNKKLTKENIINNRIPTKRLIQAGAVTLALTAMVGTAAINTNATSTEMSKTTTSGIISSMYVDDNTLLVGDNNVTSVGLDSESAKWILSLMANVEDFAYVRVAPSDDAEIAGKLRRGDMARVESLTNDGWYQITSGNLAGYIKADVSVTGTACRDFALAVGYDGSTGITVAEEQAMIEAFKTAAEEAARQQAARQAAAKAASSSASTTSTQKSSYGATTDEVTLLAAIVEKEAGGSGYQGMLAVASVVMNRVRSSSYPNTIEGVIGQKGQFTGGIAEAALAGEDIVGGKVSFRSTSTGHSGTVIGDNVFF
mgnify:CR=1 FL=1